MMEVTVGMTLRVAMGDTGGTLRMTVGVTTGVTMGDTEGDNGETLRVTGGGQWVTWG